MEDRTVVTPVDISQSGASELSVKWSDGHGSRYKVYDLRLNCRCALCVDEWSGKSLVSKKVISPDVHPVTIESVGQYALKINWSDGHNTGIYSFDHLRKLCQCPQCKKN